jgi:two-component system, sporulation sensor kinase D
MKSVAGRIVVKYIFIVVAIAIAISFLMVSNYMAADLAKEERQKIELWADAVKLAATENSNSDLDLTLRILSSNKTIPVILCDDHNNVLMSLNIDIPENDSIGYLKQKIESFRQNNTPIEIKDENFVQYVYYGDSSTLKRLQYYPFIQIAVLTIFVCVSFLALLSTKNAEQNKVWVGLSKETAHQLGTPISSLMAWMEYLKGKCTDDSILDEMGKDIYRLQVVTDRFSKIGSTPSPEIREVKNEVELSIGYFEKRISKKIHFDFDFPDQPVYAMISPSLFSWVLENLIKNAVDAMSGQGHLHFSLSQKGDWVCLDITDTGKGIAKANFREIFSPGYTTKERGWGLGLSLVKRIIEEYHHGKIYVKSSEVGVGTTFRIELKAAKI